jgi:hypothetical protein
MSLLKVLPNIDQFAPDPEDIQFMAEYFGNEVSADFIGRVEDTNGNTIFNAEVTIGDKTVLSDFNGVYVINDATVFEKHTSIEVRKNGYLEVSRAIIPKTASVNSIGITMMDSNITGSVSSGAASVVEGPNNSKVEFTGDFIRSDGSVYNGQVNVYMSYVDPSNANYPAFLPGNGIGQSLLNDAVTIADNFGLLNVKLLSPNGERLNINPQNPSILYIPKRQGATSEPPISSLWSFNENLGFWEEDENVALLSSGDYYAALVNHFSWWAASMSQNFVEFCYTLSPQNYEGDSRYVVNIINTADEDWLLWDNIQPSEDLQCLMVPEGEQFEVIIRGFALFCNTLVYEDTIGPFAMDTTLDFSFDYEIDYTQITGFASNCAGELLQNGYVYVDDNNIFSITNGVVDFTIQHCIDTEFANVQIYDFDSNTVSVTEGIPLGGNTFNIGNVITCDDNNGVFNGNVILATQQQVNEFGAAGFTTINGDLTIGGPNFTGNMGDIIDLTPLNTLQVIEGNFRISNNSNLVNLDGLDNLNSVETLSLGSNASLENVNGLNSLANDLWSIYISDNPALNSLTGLSNAIDITEWLWITNNENLTSLPNLSTAANLRLLRIYQSSFSNLSFLQNVTELPHTELYGLPNLTSLEGMEDFESFDVLRISDCDGLTDLNGLNSLTSVGILVIAGNENLLSLDGLENVISAPGINIGNDIDIDVSFPAGNPNLNDFCALQNLFINGTYDTSFYPDFPLEGGYVVFENAYNPTIEDIQNGDCSL